MASAGRAPWIAAVALAAACSPPPAAAPSPPPPPAVVVTAAPPSAEPEEPPLTRDEAMARGRELVAAWKKSPYGDEERAAWLRAHPFDEAAVRRVLAALARPCLAERDREAPPCKALHEGKDDEGASELLAGLLGEIADPDAPGSASTRLLVRLDARGIWGGGRAVERVLTRRMLAHPGVCAPPSAAEIEAARASLSDLAIVAPGDAPGKPAAARWPAAAELDDLAYLYASLAAAGPAVGSAREAPSKELPEGHPDLAARAKLRDELRASLLDGALERHVELAQAYLRTLGYPGPLRLFEEGDERWGGAGASYLMRDTARSAEILGRFELAEALYRRANPGGGMCGTGVTATRDGQIQGAIRAAELRGGCRGVVAERLFETGDRHDAYGTGRLARAGFDVPRLYGAALLTLGRRDDAALERALQALPARSSEAAARLGRLGSEAWAIRLRAIPGYADTARGAGLERLLAIAERGPGDARADALEAIGELAEDRGTDPCAGEGGWHSFSVSSQREREVHGVMSTCATRIDKGAILAAVNRVGALSADPDPAVREGAATALGRLGSPRARGVLTKLARDPYDAGGTVCTSTNGGPQRCEPNRPVARAAREALQALADAEKARAEQRRQGRKAGVASLR